MDKQEQKYEVKRLERQMREGYINITDHSGDETAFNILSEALDLYKDKYGLE